MHKKKALRTAAIAALQSYQKAARPSPAATGVRTRLLVCINRPLDRLGNVVYECTAVLPINDATGTHLLGVGSPSLAQSSHPAERRGRQARRCPFPPANKPASCRVRTPLEINTSSFQPTDLWLPPSAANCAASTGPGHSACVSGCMSCCTTRSMLMMGLK